MLKMLSVEVKTCDRRWLLPTVLLFCLAWPLVRMVRPLVRSFLLYTDPR